MNTLPAKTATEIISKANIANNIVSEQVLEQALTKVREIANDVEEYSLEKFKAEIASLEKLIPEISKISDLCCNIFEETIGISSKCHVNNHEKIIDFLIDAPDVPLKEKIKLYRKLENDDHKQSTEKLVKSIKAISGLIVCVGITIAIIKKPKIVVETIKEIVKVIKAFCTTIVKIIKMIIKAIIH